MCYPIVWNKIISIFIVCLMNGGRMLLTFRRERREPKAMSLLVYGHFTISISRVIGYLLLVYIVIVAVWKVLDVTF